MTSLSCSSVREDLGWKRLARFEASFVRTDGCWPWRDALDPGGYGKFRDRGRERAAHVLAYELYVGPVPDGLVLDHLCRNRACVNPAHLEPVTHRENILRGTSFAAQNAVKTHCPNGHPYDDANVYRSPRNQRRCRVCGRAWANAYYRSRRAG